MTQFILRVSLMLCAVLLILTLSMRVIGAMLHSPLLSYEVYGERPQIVLFDVNHHLLLPLPLNYDSYSETTWSVDGRLAFVSFSGDNNELHVYDAARRTTRILYSDLTWNSSAPAWSPDGSQIAFATGYRDDRGIYVWDFSDDSMRRVSSPEERIEGSPLWSPDGRYLVYGIQGSEVEPGRFKVIDIASGEFIASADYISLYAQVTPFSWSSDSRTIAFTHNRAGSFDVFLLDISSGDITNFTDHPADDYSPVFSPDGRYMAFSSDRRSAVNDLYIRDLQSNALTNISNAPRAQNYDLTWSPDSQSIAFVSEPYNHTEIYVYMLATGKLSRVPAISPEGDINPQWLP